MSHGRVGAVFVVAGLLASSCSLMNRTVALPENRCGLYPTALVTDLIATTVLAIVVGTSKGVDDNKALWIAPGVFAVSGVGGIVGAIMCKQQATARARTLHEVALPREAPEPVLVVPPPPTDPLRMR